MRARIGSFLLVVLTLYFASKVQSFISDFFDSKWPLQRSLAGGEERTIQEAGTHILLRMLCSFICARILAYTKPVPAGRAPRIGIRSIQACYRAFLCMWPSRHEVDILYTPMLVEKVGRGCSSSWLFAAISTSHVHFYFMLCFSSVLITPIQRLPRYRLLVGEILKDTPVDSPDRRTVEEVFNKVCEVASSVVRLKVWCSLGIFQ